MDHVTDFHSEPLEDELGQVKNAWRIEGRIDGELYAAMPVLEHLAKDRLMAENYLVLISEQHRAREILPNN